MKRLRTEEEQKLVWTIHALVHESISPVRFVCLQSQGSFFFICSDRPTNVAVPLEFVAQRGWPRVLENKIEIVSSSAACHREYSTTGIAVSAFPLTPSLNHSLFSLGQLQNNPQSIIPSLASSHFAEIWPVCTEFLPISHRVKWTLFP